MLRGKGKQLLASMLALTLVVSNVTVPVFADNKVADESVSDNKIVETEEYEIADEQYESESELPLAASERTTITVGSTVQKESTVAHLVFNCEKTGFYYFYGAIDSIDCYDAAKNTYKDSSYWTYDEDGLDYEIYAFEAGKIYNINIWSDDEDEAEEEGRIPAYIDLSFQEYTPISIDTITDDNPLNLEKWCILKCDSDESFWKFDRACALSANISVACLDSDGNIIYIPYVDEDGDIINDKSINVHVYPYETFSVFSVMADTTYIVMDAHFYSDGDDEERVMRISGFEPMPVVDMECGQTYWTEENQKLTYARFVPEEDGLYSFYGSYDTVTKNNIFGTSGSAGVLDERVWALNGGVTYWLTFSNYGFSSAKSVSFGVDKADVVDLDENNSYTGHFSQLLIRNTVISKKDTYMVSIKGNGPVNKDANVLVGFSLLGHDWDASSWGSERAYFKHELKEGNGLNISSQWKVQNPGYYKSEVVDGNYQSKFYPYNYILIDLSALSDYEGDVTVSINKAPVYEKELILDQTVYSDENGKISYHFTAPNDGRYYFKVAGYYGGVILTEEENADEYGYVSGISNTFGGLVASRYDVGAVRSFDLKKGQTLSIILSQFNESQEVVVTQAKDIYKTAIDYDQYMRFIADGGVIRTKKHQFNSLDLSILSEEPLYNILYYDFDRVIYADATKMKNKWLLSPVTYLRSEDYGYNIGIQEFASKINSMIMHDKDTYQDVANIFANYGIKVNSLYSVSNIDTGAYEEVSLTNSVDHNELLLVKQSAHDGVIVNSEVLLKGTQGNPENMTSSVYNQISHFFPVVVNTYDDGSTETLVNPVLQCASSDSDVAYYNGNRLVTFKPGLATLTFTTLDGKASASTNITVKDETISVYYSMGTDIIPGEKITNDNPNTYKSGTRLILKDPVRPGYIFDGWECSGSTTFERMTKLESNVAPYGAYYILRATWKKAGYAVQFEGNGATGGEMDKQSFGMRDSLALTPNAYTRTGYTFNGWNTKADGSGTKYADNATVSKLTSTQGKVVKLYAQWKANRYTICFDGNGGTSKTAMKNQSMTYNKKVALFDNTYSRKGYKFMGWSVDANAYELNAQNEEQIRIYKNKEEAKFNLTAENGATVTLYAQWKLVDYSITYKNVSVSSTSKYVIDNSMNPTSYTVLSEDITLEKPSKKGYTFVGWYTDESLASKYLVNTENVTIPQGTAKNKTYYAKWKANKYIVQFDGNAEGLAQENYAQSISVAKKTALTANKFKRTGYKFAGWSTDPDAYIKNATDPSAPQIKIYKNKEEVKDLTYEDGDFGTEITLYAQWKIVNYKITYNLNGTKSAKAYNSPDNPATYTVNTNSDNDYVITLSAPERVGYNFVGWYTSSTFKSSSKIESINVTKAKDYTIYAKWSKIK